MTQEEEKQAQAERIDKQLREKRMRVLHLANMIIMRPESRNPYVLETIALEIRSLAYQQRALERVKEGAVIAE